MKLEILGEYRDIILTPPEKMLGVLGETLNCIEKDGVLYVNEEVLKKEEEKFGKYLTPDEIVEDIYREARRVKMEKLEKLTIWNIIFERRRKLSSNL